MEESKRKWDFLFFQTTEKKNSYERDSYVLRHHETSCKNIFVTSSERKTRVIKAKYINK